MNKLADINLAPEGGFKGFGALGLEEGQSAPAVFTKFISSVIGLMTIIAIIWFVLLMIMGAIGIISSGGDKAALESAKKRITTGILGFVVVIAAIFIVQLIGKLIGIPNILDLPVLLEGIQQ
ncbi:hypothetical protein KKH23_03015 [Patescibacteria group bacterium]|nr:hypothetical protein [Patescibacteria group bacterium]MBU0776692.1 hypothetical protein [Patescibacteria group bacterium]MBU0846136.1 hypothetical protein [Patescibacteria group bacterium]MBU0922775.1 hypothetical protein [Patescibacteria group bacterium]MBU1066292.1 hypothetical protein [Patescibacteria group bacterium]